MAQFSINNTDVIELTNKLQKINRSAMPVSVRGSLNDAAFDMKIKSIPIIWGQKFTVRKPTFIKAHTAVQKSPNTFNLNAMVAKVGIIRGKSKAGDELIKQEFGGTLTGRNIIPTTASRISKNAKKLVSKRFYFNKIGKNKKSGKNTIVKTKKSLLSIGKNDKWTILYRIRENLKLKPRPFMLPAKKITEKKIPNFYFKRAKKQFEKVGWV